MHFTKMTAVQEVNDKKALMHKHSSKDKVKASLWIPKKEFKKIAELSGDLSIDLFIMRAIRKQIQEEERKQHPLLKTLHRLVAQGRARQQEQEQAVLHLK